MCDGQFSKQIPTCEDNSMSVVNEAPAITVARRHVEAWDNHDFDAARASLASDVHVTAMSVDPSLPVTDTTGIEEYMQGLVAFAQAVVPGSTRVNISLGDENRALLQVTSRVRFGPDAAEMALHAARLYLLDAGQKIKQEQIVFFVTAN
jgi:hypothetical protein